VIDDLKTAALLCEIDPDLGGLAVRGDGFDREALAALLNGPVRRLPVHIDQERLLGGLDLAATLAADRAIARQGLLADADSGWITIPMAERIDPAIAAHIAAAMDAGEVVAERDGLGLRSATVFRLLLLDEGVEEETPPACLMERVAFWFDSAAATDAGGRAAALPVLASTGDLDVRLDEDQFRAIAHAAAAFGVEGVRGALFAVRAAKAHARLSGRAEVSDDDLALAIRLVLVPRATQYPAAEAPPEDAPDPETGASEATGTLEDVVLEAVKAALPANIIAAIAERGRKAAAARAKGAGRKPAQRGRPAGTRAGRPGGGNRLSLIETLRAAAPWQKLRRVEGDTRIRIRRDDIRIKRFKSSTGTTTIFAVDASGSAAAARLAEAKGAVELLLAESYVKRAQVALVSFRGTGAEVLLPPTRSLTRARRLLAELPGGGGTPLAAGLAATREVALAVRAKDRAPFIVVLTDGRANIAADGSANAAAAQADAAQAAKAMRGLSGVVIDISARPRDDARVLAAAMDMRFLALPRGDANALGNAVRAA